MAAVLRDSGELIQCLENIEPLANWGGCVITLSEQ